MAEPITIAQLIDASEDAQTLALFSNADAATQVPRRLADPIETLDYWRNYMAALAAGKDGVDAAITSMTVATGEAGTAATVITGGTPTARTFALTIPRGDKGVDGSFSQKSYTTYALMDADKLNIPANTSVSVTNDTDTTKNGMYAYNGTAFTKSAYDPLTQSKTYTDTAKSSAISTAASDATTKADNAKTQAIADSKTYTDTKVKTLSDSIPISNLNTGLVQAVVDAQGTIIDGLYPNGSIETPHPPLRGFGADAVRGQILSREELNAAGAYLDKDSSRDKSPINFDILVAANKSDGLAHCRMASMHQLSETKFYVVFTQFGSAGDDQGGGRLAARFVDVDFTAKTAVVSGTIVLHDGLSTGEHPPAQPHFFTVDNDVLLIYQQDWDIVTLRSSDDCVTWSEVGRYSTGSIRRFNIALNGIVRIPAGKYAGRLVATGFDYGYDGNIDWSLRSMYSDNDGVSWTQGWDVRGTSLGWSNVMNETGITVLTDNTLLMTFRNDSNTDRNAAGLYELKWGKSIDGGKSFKQFYPDVPFMTTACQVGMMQAAPNVWDGVPKILTTAPYYNARTGLKLRISYNNAKTWAVEKTLIPNSMVTGYSTIHKVSRDTYGIVHEYGGFNAVSNIAIRFINNQEIYNDNSI